MSLHDYWIYAQQVDHDAKCIVLHTLYPHCEPQEVIDVIFEDVLVHHFQTQQMATSALYPSNVLFDIEEEDAATTVKRYWHAIARERNYGWPAQGWTSMEELARILISQGHRSFHVHGTVGLDGFIFAKRMVLKPRPSRWALQAEPDAAPNSRPPSQFPTSPEVQSPDSLRTPSSGGCG